MDTSSYCSFTTKPLPIPHQLYDVGLHDVYIVKSLATSDTSSLFFYCTDPLLANSYLTPTKTVLSRIVRCACDQESKKGC
jgi:hypothetical protein